MGNTLKKRVTLVKMENTGKKITLKKKWVTLGDMRYI